MKIINAYMIHYMTDGIKHLIAVQAPSKLWACGKFEELGLEVTSEVNILEVVVIPCTSKGVELYDLEDAEEV
jgi:hypothetical protein